MPFYIRKSVKAGPFRFNFSKGGVGVSVGVKGLRVGTGPRGHYVHAGRGGLYYRASLGSAGKRHHVARHPPPSVQVTFEESTVNMMEIESGDVMEMRDEKFSDLLDEINAKASQWRLSALFGWIFALLGILLVVRASPVGIWVLIAALPAWAIGSWLDSYRRSTVLFYDIDGPVEQAYKDIVAAFDGLNGCAGKWHIEAGGAINDLTTWKRNAGASHLVKRTATKLGYALPKVIKSNITPPSMQVGKQVIYFMPDVALIAHNSRFGAVSYSDLRVRWQESRFIEDGHVPRDAKIVDHTWQHPNKSGGPDRRFRNNRQLPVCLYDTLHLQSDSGLNEVLEFSQVGKLSGFVDGCRALARAKTEASEALKAIPAMATPSSQQSAPGSVLPTVSQPKNSVRATALIVAGIFGLPVAIALFQNAGHSTKPSTTQAVFGNGAGQVPPQSSAAMSTTSSSSPDQTVQPAKASSTQASSTQASAPTVDQASSSRLQPEQEPTPDPAAFETLAAAATAPDTSPAVASIEPPALPYVVPSEPKFAYLKLPIQLREGPGSKYVPVGVVGQNALLAVLETEGGWVHVSGGPSAIGWVPKEVLSQRPVSLQTAAPAQKKTQNTYTPPPRQGGR
ncbi:MULTISPECIES: SH3 domain-containing protein [Rhizobium]|uniref:SH3 domain-containing protein n=1 Tax=Rhizobium TaxID=379 RepID=UPI00026ECDC7|nr:MULTISPECIES: SH3 domain-containing protein [Rhizobium]OCJ26428.1 hypothetical protein A6U88_03715 [Agrobacterium sp. B131/95]EJK87332.1 hypothetical protein PMI03_01343 [Rhizobium sp. AP16]MDJ1632174.1 SH3 domain-containing protein [Rhizobium rhizogenes]NTG73569.1 DUF4236 domain-containing protein [Rhizobium rhizogenes]NTH12116.1 DUF4236 domain-containing protein [Rhizobium rhizogenes]